MDVIVACYPDDLAAVPAHQRAAYDAMTAQGLAMNDYPNSTIAQCERCGVLVRVGPRQRAAVAEGASVLCMYDAAMDQPATVVSLGNPAGTSRPTEGVP